MFNVQFRSEMRSILSGNSTLNIQHYFGAYVLSRMLKKASLLTRPTLATTSPARPESAKTASSPWDALYPRQGPSNSLYLPLGKWPRLPLTARIERAQFHRARSASKKGTWPLPPHPSEAARCASTGIVPATPSSLFQHPAKSESHSSLILPGTVTSAWYS